MSSIYITEPNTEGKVLLHTSFGDLDVELWPQQAPKAVRSFVQLCLEGYYDQTIFHRIIAGFMVQGGDPTGTGSGGESIYGAPFIDEFHSRLRFNHRGLLAMANENKPNSNHSQFFFTLDACDFLDKKHTIFGKVTGNTIFNLLSVGDLETDANDRPTNPPKLLSAEVLWNPFEDIVPRAVKCKEASTTEDSQKKKKRERKATKDLKLLSFGDEEEAFQDEVDGGATKSKKKKAKKIMSSHDLLDDRKLKSEVDAEVLQRVADTSDEAASEEKKERSRASLKAAVAAASAVSKHLQGNEKLSGEKVEGSAKRSDSTIVGRLDTESQEKKKDREEYVKLREELRKAKKAVPLLMGEEAKKQEKDRAFQDMLTPLQQQRQKYLQRKKTSNRSAREQDTLSKLKKFQAALIDVNVNQREPSKAKESNGSQQEDAEAESYHGQILEDGDDDGDDTNDDKSWMTAKLKFKKHIDDQFRAGNELSADDYLTIDSRNEKDQRSRGESRKTGERDRRDRSRDSSRHSRHRGYDRRDRRDHDRRR
ncbi:peptidylprolyl isomerase [Phytophthora cinnamomi]|uniref:peptidylprolyl isomerase n=1 Tax=Phytophthora cinnamomi TaxID=4785 RepID=UPI0035597FB0|nr:peptidylprolyl isomerase [Phytophthora cinnamomi]